MGRVLPFVAAVLVTTVAHATVLVPAEFNEIVGGSEIIAYARVVDVRPEWADGRRWIDSVVTAEVVSYIKGGSEETISFKVPGGKLGRYRSVVVGAPVFAPRRRGCALPQGARERFARCVRPQSGRVQRARRRAHRPADGRAAAGAGRRSASRGAETVKRGSIDRRPLAFDAFGARGARGDGGERARGRNEAARH